METGWVNTSTTGGGKKISPQVFINLKRDEEIRTYLQLADEHTAAIGYTEHGLRHATQVASNAGFILSTLDFPENQVQLAKIAGYLHDIGNLAGRANHPQMGAVLCRDLLVRFNLTPRQRGIIMSAVGNHEEGSGKPVNAVAAAVIIADKGDVHRTRVRRFEEDSNDIHDRVNYACISSMYEVDGEERRIQLKLEIDTDIASVMDYFSIFSDRMMMCEGAAQSLGCKFRLNINDFQLG